MKSNLNSQSTQQKPTARLLSNRKEPQVPPNATVRKAIGIPQPGTTVAPSPHRQPRRITQ